MVSNRFLSPQERDPAFLLTIDVSDTAATTTISTYYRARSIGKLGYKIHLATEYILAVCYIRVQI